MARNVVLLGGKAGLYNTCFFLAHTLNKPKQTFIDAPVCMRAWQGRLHLLGSGAIFLCYHTVIFRSAPSDGGPMTGVVRSTLPPCSIICFNYMHARGCGGQHHSTATSAIMS